MKICLLPLVISLAILSPVWGNPEIDHLQKLADSGDPDAQISLGMRYRDGLGVERDYVEALRYYRRCADGGNAAGMDNVGFMYLRGWGVPENFHIAAGYFKASAARGHAQGMFNLGNCYFSGQGVEQNYSKAIASWEQAAARGNQHASWKLAMLHAPGEGTPKDQDKASELCATIAGAGHVEAMLLMGELLAVRGKPEAAARWWQKAADRGSAQGRALLELSKWRDRPAAPEQFGLVEVDHLYQGWNNCGATSLAMLLRHAGVNTTPYAVKRLCPQSPIGTGTDWEHLVAAGEMLDEDLTLVTFPDDDAGFGDGTKVIRDHIDAGRPVVIDFTVTRETGGRVEHFGHTLLVVGYHADLDQFVLKNPNQPSPGIELMSSEELEKSWRSRGYSRSAKGRSARPLIVLGEG